MTTQLTSAQMRALGIQNLSHTQREQFLQRIGNIVFDNAIEKLMDTLSDEQMTSLTHAVDSYDSFNSVIDHLIRVYPDFNKHLISEQDLFIRKFNQRIKEEQASSK